MIGQHDIRQVCGSWEGQSDAKLGRGAVDKPAKNLQSSFYWRPLSAQPVRCCAVFFRWFRFLCETAGFVNGARPGSFQVVLWKYLPIWRFMVVTMTPTLDRLFLTSQIVILLRRNVNETRIVRTRSFEGQSAGPSNSSAEDSKTVAIRPYSRRSSFSSFLAFAWLASAAT